MNDKMIEKAEEAIRALADKMGIATKEFWPTFIRNQQLDAVVCFIWLAIWAYVAINLVPMCLTWPATADLERYDFDGLRWFMRFLGCAIILATTGAVFCSLEQIKYLGNLKYWALKDFLATLGNLTHGNKEE